MLGSMPSFPRRKRLCYPVPSTAQSELIQGDVEDSFSTEKRLVGRDAIRSFHHPNSNGFRSLLFEKEPIQNIKSTALQRRNNSSHTVSVAGRVAPFFIPQTRTPDVSRSSNLDQGFTVGHSDDPYINLGPPRFNPPQALSLPYLHQPSSPLLPLAHVRSVPTLLTCRTLHLSPLSSSSLLSVSFSLCCLLTHGLIGATFCQSPLHSQALCLCRLSRKRRKLPLNRTLVQFLPTTRSSGATGVTLPFRKSASSPPHHAYASNLMTTTRRGRSERRQIRRDTGNLGGYVPLLIACVRLTC